MEKLYLGVRIPEKTYSRVTLEKMDFSKSVSFVKGEISKKINFPREEIELIYRGNILNDNEIISELNVEPNATVHVFKKTKKPTPDISNKVYTNDDCLKIANVFGTVTGAQIDVRTKARILHKLFIAYPEFRENLGAQAIIVDPVLFHALSKIEVIKKIAENYRIICDAAELIVDTVKKEIVNSTEFHYVGREDLYSSSEEEENSNTTLNTEQTNNSRRINRNELADALLLATSASLNSLSNMGQRNARFNEQEQQRNAASSSSGVSTTPVGITPTIFINALNQALISTVNNRRNGNDQIRNMRESHSNDSLSTTPWMQHTERFMNEMQLMREMGLNDDNANRQALIISNGDVESAVSLVLGGLNNLFN